MEELKGPVSGIVTLPRHLDWGPERSYRLDEITDIRILYMRVIRESASVADLRQFLDAGTLRRLWPQLVLPPRTRVLWEQRFPELRRQAA